jgi:hypothetical protein
VIDSEIVCDQVSKVTSNASRLLINHSLRPLSGLPRKRAGEKIMKEAIFSRALRAKG